MKDTKGRLGLAVLSAGLLFHFLWDYFYVPTLNALGYVLLVAGILLLVIGQKKGNGMLGKTFLRGLVCLVAGLIVRPLSAYAGLFLLQLAASGLIILGFVLIVLGQLRPEVQETVEVREQDAQLSQQIRKQQANIRLWRLLKVMILVVFFILFFVSAVSESYGALIVVSIIGSILYMVVDHYQDKLKTFVGENIVRQALEEVFQVEEYRPFGCIPQDHIRGSYFGIGDFDAVHGTDYMRGSYKGLGVELCDMRLTRQETRILEDGRTEEYDVNVFQGFWLICDFGKPLSADIRLWERGKLGKLVGGKGIQTENESFNKHFHVESAIAEEAFYILTPHMMEYILEMDKKAEGETHLRFERSGRVQIAIERDYDLFEVDKKARDASLLRAKYVREIRYITDLIDELRLVDTLYR